MRRLLLTVAFLAWAGPVWAQTVTSTQFGSEDNVGGTSATIAAVNVTAGEALVTIVFLRQNAGQTTNGTATHGGTSLGTPLIDDSAGDGIDVTVFCTLGLSGSQTVTVPLSAAGTLWHMYAIRVSSPNVTTPCGTPTLASGGSAATAISAAVSTIGSSDLVVSAVLVRDKFASTLAPDAGQTQLDEHDGASYASATATEPGTGGSVTSGWTWTGGIEDRIVVFNMRAVAGGGGGCTGTRLALTGAGC